MKVRLFSIFFFFFISSCADNEYKRLNISATTWIGYSPIYYAKEKGWLKPLNIKVLHVSSLSENMYLYQAGNADAFVGTQYEYNLLSKKDPDLLPIIMLDRSNGGDIIMSNKSIDDLKKTTAPIDAYLEMDSINNTMLTDFIRTYGLEENTFNYINQDQANILNVEYNSDSQILIVTYIPYDFELAKKGFKEIASTKDGLDLLVVDAMFTTTQTLNNHKEQFVLMKKHIDAAVRILEQNPREFYEVVKHYINNISYEEFLMSLEDIVWINDRMSPDLIERLKFSQFPTRDLL
ncbi:MAG: hypothetical protein OEY19_06305 [Gammaproteobacteria bacterium]|nr:hypothetical protein [Gammaproteobacteria bacterium]